MDAAAACRVTIRSVCNTPKRLKSKKAIDTPVAADNRSRGPASASFAKLSRAKVQPNNDRVSGQQQSVAANCCGAPDTFCGKYWRKVHQWAVCKEEKEMKQKEIAFAFVWLVLGLPALVTVDILLLTIYLTSDLKDYKYLEYYERLRFLSESLFESLPQCAFQIVLFELSNSDTVKVDSRLLGLSVFLSLGSLLYNC